MAPSDCSICLMPIEPDESVVGLACAHLCHQECVQTHMRISRVPLMDFLRCPQCRMTSFDIVKLETALLDLPADAANTTSPARTWPRTPSPFSSPIADSSAEWESPSWRQWPHPEPLSQDAASLSWLFSERLFQCTTPLPWSLPEPLFQDATTLPGPLPELWCWSGPMVWVELWWILPAQDPNGTVYGI